MFITRIKKRYKGKTYQTILLRESYREKVGGKSRVLTKTLLNLSKYPKKQVDAMEFVLKHPEVLSGLDEQNDILAPQVVVGRSVGAVWVVAKLAERLGITKALGRGRQAQLALWQIIARVIEQGSRLSAVRLHEVHALAEVVGLERGFNENNLYDNLAWLSEHQSTIEKRLFKARHGASKPKLFLYDVTSSYLEGDKNALGAYGYPRDGKKGKKQIVVGLLCDIDGEPVSVEVFAGNTQDPKTVASQIHKTAKRFGCTEVTFIGDRGMIKSGQMDALNEEKFHYITALTKPQIEKLLKDGAIQMELFDENVCEVQCDGRRLVLRRNPMRAEELAATRQSKRAAVKKLLAEQNTYLVEHPKARVETAIKRVQKKIDKLKLVGWMRLEADERTLGLEIDEDALEAAARLDGCYVIVTDLMVEQADAKTVHDRYKDLAKVERAFRISKTGHLELRPIHVRTEASTRGHVFVVMLSYLIRRELDHAWSHLDLTVEEGLDALKMLTTVHITVGGISTQCVSKPQTYTQRLLDAVEIQLPHVLPENTVRVVTKRKLPSRRVTN